jgi:hypothetical protein
VEKSEKNAHEDKTSFGRQLMIIGHHMIHNAAITVALL